MSGWFAGFAVFGGVGQLDSVIAGIRDKFAPKIAEGNVAAAREAYAFVKEEMEASHA